MTDKGISRRELLKRSAVLGGAAVVGSRGGWARAADGRVDLRRRHDPVPGGGSILDVPASQAPVDHVVVLMMENRSFDHYLGWLATDDHFIETGRRKYGKDFGVVGDQTQTYAHPTGGAVDTYYLPTRSKEHNPYRGYGHPDPGHGWDSGRAQRDRGFLGEGSGNDEYALGFYAANDIPFYAQLARRFTTFDRYHCSVLGPTFPNREYMHSAQSGGKKDNSLPSGPTGFEWDTIWDRLRAASVPHGYYYVDLPASALWGPRLLPITHHIERFFADCQSGTLPNVVFVDPGFTTGLRTDDHPFADIRAGQRYVFNVFKAFAESPHWERGVLFINYDEWGGFFDHVAPPVLPDDRASEKDEENFGQAGFRVPGVMASPYARPGFVDPRLYDHTSILRFIEWRFLGAPAEGPGSKGDSWFLTTRDRHAWNIGVSLLLEGADPEVHVEDAPQAAVASPPDEEPLEGLPAAADEMHAFEHAHQRGFFERMGYPVPLRPLPVS